MAECKMKLSHQVALLCEQHSYKVYFQVTKQTLNGKNG